MADESGAAAAAVGEEKKEREQELLLSLLKESFPSCDDTVLSYVRSSLGERGGRPSSSAVDHATALIQSATDSEHADTKKRIADCLSTALSDGNEDDEDSDEEEDPMAQRISAQTQQIVTG